MREPAGEPYVVFVVAVRRTSVDGRQVWTCSAQGKQFVATGNPGEIDKEAIDKAARTLAGLVGREVVSPLASEIGGKVRQVGVGVIGDVISAIGRRIEGKINGTPTG